MTNQNNIFKGRRKFFAILGKMLVSICFWFSWPLRSAGAKRYKQEMRDVMKLPVANIRGTIAVERAIAQRRSVRSFIQKMMSLNQLAQLLWAAQGITEKGELFRSTPSAGALYPMDVYVVVGQGGVAEIEAGVYHYEPREHWLSRVAKHDLREGVAKAALSQMWIATAPVNLIITAEYKRVSIKYGKRGERYAMIEAGHIGQNIFLQAEVLGLNAGIVGAFHDTDINKLLNLPREHEPLLIMPVGYTA
jgi:SagB-type dehydrogenase family enzyme